MYNHFSFFHLIYLGISVLLEAIANVFLKLSEGFKNKKYACAAIILVMGAFTALSFAVKGMQLSVAYAIWGGLGLVLTAILSIFLFDEWLRLSGWLGVLLILVGMIVMKFSHLL